MQIWTEKYVLEWISNRRFGSYFETLKMCLYDTYRSDIRQYKGGLLDDYARTTYFETLMLDSVI